MLSSDVHRGFAERVRLGLSTEVRAVLGVHEVVRVCRMLSIAPEMSVKLSETGVNKAVVMRLAMVLVEGEKEERPIAFERIESWVVPHVSDIGRERPPRCSHPETETTRNGTAYVVTCTKCGDVIETNEPEPTHSVPVHDDEHDCAECGGDGRCAECMGSGADADEECYPCNGSGACVHCDGTSQRPRAEPPPRVTTDAEIASLVHEMQNYESPPEDS